MHLRELFARSVPTSAAIFVLLASPFAASNPLAKPSLEELVETQNNTLTPRGYYYGYGSTAPPWTPTDFTSWPPVTSPPAGGGYWQTYTETYVMTNYVTKTYIRSRYIPYAATTATTTKKPIHCGAGQEACGNICCATWQMCRVEGYCVPRGGQSYASYSPPIAVTSNGVVITVAESPLPAPTVPFQPAATAGSVGVTTKESSGGLSGGAIAGIVIGVIIAIIILIILCLILCFRAAWDSLLAVFGLGKRKRRRETVEYESYHRHGSRSDHKSWYGEKPNRPPPKKESRVGGWGKVAAALGAFAIALGLKRRHDRKRRDDKSGTSSSYYSSSYTGSSSDRRTRDTRQSSRR